MDFAEPVDVGMAVSIQVPWNATNRQHIVNVAVQTADGTDLASTEGSFVSGRPANIEPGSIQRTIIPLKFPLMLQGPRTYVVVASMNGRESKRVTFQALPAVQMPDTPAQR